MHCYAMLLINILCRKPTDWMDSIEFALRWFSAGDYREELVNMIIACVGLDLEYVVL